MIAKCKRLFRIIIFFFLLVVSLSHVELDRYQLVNYIGQTLTLNTSNIENPLFDCHTSTKNVTKKKKIIKL